MPKSRSRLHVELTFGVLEQLLRLPPGAEIVRVRQDLKRRGMVLVDVTGKGATEYHAGTCGKGRHAALTPDSVCVRV